MSSNYSRGKRVTQQIANQAGTTQGRKNLWAVYRVFLICAAVGFVIGFVIGLASGGIGGGLASGFLLMMIGIIFVAPIPAFIALRRANGLGRQKNFRSSRDL